MRMVNKNITMIKIVILILIIGFMYCTHKFLEFILILRHFALPEMKKAIIVRLYLLNLVLMIFRGDLLTTYQIFQQVNSYNEESP